MPKNIKVAAIIIFFIDIEIALKYEKIFCTNLQMLSIAFTLKTSSVLLLSAAGVKGGGLLCPLTYASVCESGSDHAKILVGHENS